MAIYIVLRFFSLTLKQPIKGGSSAETAGGLFVAIVLEMGNSGLASMRNSKVKRIVCFANSRKLGGRCIAGKE